MILNDPYIPRFQGHAIFDAEYIRNGTIYRNSFNGIAIGTYTRPSQPCRFEWSLVILSNLAKYSMRRSVERSLCDDWASCYITRWSTVKSVKTIGILKYVKNKLPDHILRSLYFTLVNPYYEYCNIVWAVKNTVVLQKLFISQKRLFGLLLIPIGVLMIPILYSGDCPY